MAPWRRRVVYMRNALLRSKPPSEKHRIHCGRRRNFRQFLKIFSPAPVTFPALSESKHHMSARGAGGGASPGHSGRTCQGSVMKTNARQQFPLDDVTPGEDSARADAAGAPFGDREQEGRPVARISPFTPSHIGDFAADETTAATADSAAVSTSSSRGWPMKRWILG